MFFIALLNALQVAVKSRDAIVGEREGGGGASSGDFTMSQLNDLFFIQHSFTLTRLPTKQLHNALDDIYSYNRNIRHLTTILSEYQAMGVSLVLFLIGKTHSF